VVLDSKLYADQATEEGANVTTAIGEDLKIWSKWVAAGDGLGGKGGSLPTARGGLGALCCPGCDGMAILSVCGFAPRSRSCKDKRAEPGQGRAGKGGIECCDAHG